LEAGAFKAATLLKGHGSGISPRQKAQKIADF
jgi:hypothetical protein